MIELDMQGIDVTSFVECNDYSNVLGMGDVDYEPGTGEWHSEFYGRVYDGRICLDKTSLTPDMLRFLWTKCKVGDKTIAKAFGLSTSGVSARRRKAGITIKTSILEGFISGIDNHLNELPSGTEDYREAAKLMLDLEHERQHKMLRKQNTAANTLK